jgi:hypothetical protein
MGHMVSMIDTFKEQFKCDTARISVASRKMYLIIGWNRNTKDIPGQWYEFVNGKSIPRDLDYIEEKTIASGYTATELIESANEYEKLSVMTWEQFFNDPLSDKIYQEVKWLNSDKKAKTT